MSWVARLERQRERSGKDEVQVDASEGCRAGGTQMVQGVWSLSQRHREPRSDLVFFRKHHLDTQKSEVFGGPRNYRLPFAVGSKGAARRCSLVILNNIHWGAGLLSLPALG